MMLTALLAATKGSDDIHVEYDVSNILQSNAAEEGNPISPQVATEKAEDFKSPPNSKKTTSRFDENSYQRTPGSTSKGLGLSFP